MRAYTPGGRFDADFETTDILAGIDADLKNPVGTSALWYVWDQATLSVDPIYGTGQNITGTLGGRKWIGPYVLPVVRAVIKQGQVKTSAVGSYNADELHLTLNIEDVERIAPGVIANPDVQNKGRIIWRNQVYRPYSVQERGIVAERFTILAVDCIQVMPDEMVNDPQFQSFAS